MEKHPENPRNHRTERYIRYTLTILAVLLLLLVVFFVAQYESLRRAQIISMRQFHVSQLLERHAPISVTSASVVRSWMTFDYINRLFALPPDYLKNNVPITDLQYPKLTISSYVKKNGLNQTTFLDELDATIRNYSPLQNATST
jgi:heme/copper-type cytochrome/quinol oxidase subunit 2